MPASGEGQVWYTNNADQTTMHSKRLVWSMSMMKRPIALVAICRRVWSPADNTFLQGRVTSYKQE
jgi:hypothetical protein